MESLVAEPALFPGLSLFPEIATIALVVIVVGGLLALFYIWTRW
ncbi:hypothetical protein [Haloterrigena alkaliphila]|nr:hypothetical protein [Haloterrigena alkaliphila]